MAILDDKRQRKLPQRPGGPGSNQPTFDRYTQMSSHVGVWSLREEVDRTHHQLIVEKTAKTWVVYYRGHHRDFGFRRRLPRLRREGLGGSLPPRASLQSANRTRLRRFNSNCSRQASPTLRAPNSAYTVDHAKSTNSAGHIAAYRPSQRSAGPDLGTGSGGALH